MYDDDTEILFLCTAILSNKKYRLETRTRCENVIEDIALIQPDLILMDLWIPNIGGEAAIQALKQNADTRHIPILLFSANADIASISQKIHADGYIEKPFEIVHFKEMIERHTLETPDTSR